MEYMTSVDLFARDVHEAVYGHLPETDDDTDETPEETDEEKQD